jgi:threonine/homoserine/homoserine lactone efflux protein
VARLLSRRPGWLRVRRWLMATVLGGLAVRLLADHAWPAVA